MKKGCTLQQSVKSGRDLKTNVEKSNENLRAVLIGCRQKAVHLFLFAHVDHMEVVSLRKPSLIRCHARFLLNCEAFRV